MKIGVLSFVATYTEDPGTVARRCEALGFESFWLPEHAIIPVEHKTPYPRSRDGKIPDDYSHIIDPFVGLAFAAAATKTIKLATGVCLVPEHDPLVLAKSVATLDHFSGGRFLFGVGAGWLRDESEIMGVDFRRRWPLTREYLRAMKELWTKPEASFEGEFVKFPPVKSNPKPAQKPHPPILIGAGGERALKNTALVGDGWAPIALAPAQLREQLQTLKQLCDQAGRDARKMDITVFAPVGGKEPRRALDEYAEAGAHRLVLFPSSLAPGKAEGVLTDLARQWIA
ncbi:MAG TPA: LLM class F420-dependent oxidoreductase [Candidatus Binataceae bacterium]